MNRIEVLINGLEIENHHLQEIVDCQSDRILYLEDALAAVNIELVKAQKKRSNSLMEYHATVGLNSSSQIVRHRCSQCGNLLKIDLSELTHRIKNFKDEEQKTKDIMKWLDNNGIVVVIRADGQSIKILPMDKIFKGETLYKAIDNAYSWCAAQQEKEIRAEILIKELEEKLQTAKDQFEKEKNKLRRNRLFT